MGLSINISYIYRNPNNSLSRPQRLGATPAHIAAQNGYTGMVQLLHEIGADVHRTRNDGIRGIHVAAIDGRRETVELLLHLRSDVDPSGIAETPLMYACTEDRFDVVSLLISAKCDVNRNSSLQGATATDFCLSRCPKGRSLSILQSNGGVSGLGR